MADRHSLLVALDPVAGAVGAEPVEGPGPADATTDGDIRLRWGDELVRALRPPPVRGTLERLALAIDSGWGRRLTAR